MPQSKYGSQYKDNFFRLNNSNTKKGLGYSIDNMNDAIKKFRKHKKEFKPLSWM